MTAIEQDLIDFIQHAPKETLQTLRRGLHDYAEPQDPEESVHHEEAFYGTLPGRYMVAPAGSGQPRDERLIEVLSFGPAETRKWRNAGDSRLFPMSLLPCSLPMAMVAVNP
jgi:hypothetical protein